VAACGVPAATESAVAATEDLGKSDGAWCSASSPSPSWGPEAVTTQWLQSLEKRLAIPDAALEAHVAAMVARCMSRDESDQVCDDTS